MTAIKTRLAGTAPPDFVGKHKEDSDLWDQARVLYETRQNAPAWIARGKPRDSVHALTTLLAAAGDEGLNPQEYDVDAITARAEGLEEKKDAATAMDLELYLTYTLLRYSSDLAFGHPIAQAIDKNWTVVQREIDVPGIVNEALNDNAIDTLPTRLAPPHPEYARVKEMLQRYRKIAAEGKLRPIPQDIKLKLGEAGPGLAELRNNLLILGDFQEQPQSGDNVFQEDLPQAQAEFELRNAVQPEKTPDAKKIAVIDIYDENLSAAVRRFEARHGLDPDGVPDAAMIAAMNVPASVRVRQLEINLERWRWMPADFGTPHIVVNIAGYQMQVRDTNETVPVKMRVIVGKETNRTPIFSDVITTVVFSPYWNIPQSIGSQEMLPLVKKDPDYFNKKNIEVRRIIDGETQTVDASTIDWENADDLSNLQLRQKPGSANALGYVKFIFPNRHNVYLHDTPTDNLFDQLTRDLSHGCVRLEEPGSLAEYLLRDQPEWTTERIEAAMHSGTEKHVALKNPIAVHLVYLTARVDEDGVAQFFEDVYGFDVKQQELLRLEAPSSTIERVPQPADGA